MRGLHATNQLRWQACQSHRWLPQPWPAKVTQGSFMPALQDAAAALAWLGTGENDEREPTPEETPSSQAGRPAFAAQAAGGWVKLLYCCAVTLRGLIRAAVAAAVQMLAALFAQQSCGPATAVQIREASDVSSWRLRSSSGPHNCAQAAQCEALHNISKFWCSAML